jgi:RimJ/RimL family protein N-acetyltransferase
MELRGYTIRLAEPKDQRDIQSLYESDPSYFEIAQGAPPGSAEVQSLFTALPEGKDYGDKFVYTIFDNSGDLVAVIDLIRDYPRNGLWFLGLLFVAPCCRNIGLGTSILDAICAHVKQHGGHTLRLGVVRGNIRARALYDRLGFHFVYERQRTQLNGFTIAVDVLERTC